jgi:formate dehydrogenase subunit gamma
MNDQPAPAAAAGDAAPNLAGILTGVLARHGTRQDQLLPVLHALQDRLGFVPPDAVQDIAEHFNLSRAEVHGVVTFYHHFRSSPPARCTVQVCRAEACQSMGADGLLAHARQALGCGLHEHSADGAFALEPVYCLGLCASSPAMSIDGVPFARVTPARFDRLVADAAATRAVEAA